MEKAKLKEGKMNGLLLGVRVSESVNYKGMAGRDV
jgi:hypothetical protein